jgi:hypothetical protein
MDEEIHSCGLDDQIPHSQSDVMNGMPVGLTIVIEMLLGDRNY